MQCTPEQIEEKRKLAQQKLLYKRAKDDSSTTAAYNQENRVNNVGTSNSLHSPNKQFLFKPYTKTKPVLPFYGTNKLITANFYLISELRFAVNLSEYFAPAIDIFKTITSKSYNIKTRIWDFDISDYQVLLSKFFTLQSNVIVTKIPKYALNVCQQQKSDYSQIDLSRIDPELVQTLMPFQEDGVRFGIDKGGRCLIADDMGLGKTFQALGIASYYQEDWPLLVITTSSMKNIWQDTIHRYLPNTALMDTQYMISAKDYIGDAKIIIASHDMMTRAVDKLKERKFGVIIIDESHTLKNSKAKCTQAASILAKTAKRVILLSGTPALSRPSELFSQLALIDGRFFGNFFDYSKRYCDGRTTNFGWDATGQSNLQELEVVLNKRFMIRRTKEDVLKMLPEKKQQVITLDVKLSQMSEDDRKNLSILATQYNNVKRGVDKQAALVTFFAETCKIKIPFVCSYILQVLDETDKFLVFAHHQKMLDAIQQLLICRNKKFIRIDGNTTSEQRKYFVDKFQLDDSYACAILSITAANAGITLTRAKLILFAELHWNPSILSQAESRAHRIGQEDEVIARYLLAPGTADDAMWHIIQEKQQTLNQIGLSKESFDNVSVSKQSITKKESITDYLDPSTTTCRTLDISSYFTSPKKQTESTTTSELNTSNSMDFFDDGMDDVLSKLDV
ncbi:dna annealing helicase and endonuclease zranb3 family member [Holotrichia oblita]|uniref:Dna annealing helicase and endonuclease zranb3 family member n=1 Tax=Holotrichia oblita TaxID=644536 RepID=A0ACB9SQJ8_HOLOL|nr:dna annealing helicase and endonuclease zranb3 family member [Holotrichia oblita]